MTTPMSYKVVEGFREPTESCGCVFCDLGLEPEGSPPHDTPVHWVPRRKGYVTCTRDTRQSHLSHSPKSEDGR